MDLEEKTGQEEGRDQARSGGRKSCSLSIGDGEKSRPSQLTCPLGRGRWWGAVCSPSGLDERNLPQRHDGCLTILPPSAELLPPVPRDSMVLLAWDPRGFRSPSTLQAFNHPILWGVGLFSEATLPPCDPSNTMFRKSGASALVFATSASHLFHNATLPTSVLS